MNGAILSSTDEGCTWQRTDLPFKHSGPMPRTVRPIIEMTVSSSAGTTPIWIGWQHRAGL